MVEEYLGALTAHVLRISPSRLDRSVPLSDAGIDSLLAIELKNRIELDLRIIVPIAKLLKGPSVRSLAIDILPLVEDAQDKTPQPVVRVAIEPQPAPAPVSDALDEIGELSDDEMESLLSQLAEPEVQR